MFHDHRAMRRLGRAGMVVHGLYFLMIFASFSLGFVFVVYKYTSDQTARAKVIMQSSKKSAAAPQGAAHDPCASYISLLEAEVSGLRKAMWVLGIALFGMFAKDVFVAGIWIKSGKSHYDHPYER